MGGFVRRGGTQTAHPEPVEGRADFEYLTERYRIMFNKRLFSVEAIILCLVAHWQILHLWS
jgi:hypothetical protein